METYYSTTISSTSTTIHWWTSYPYYQQPRYQPEVWHCFVPLNPTPPKEEIQKMTDEEFDAALNDLLFGDKQEEPDA